MKLSLATDVLLLLHLSTLIICCSKEPIVQPTYRCDPSQVISYSEISPILITKCAVSGCHTATNNYLPHLTTELEVSNNRADCRAQILNNAMPPTSSLALTADEKAKLICWLENGIN